MTTTVNKVGSSLCGILEVQKAQVQRLDVQEDKDKMFKWWKGLEVCMGYWNPTRHKLETRGSWDKAKMINRLKV